MTLVQNLLESKASTWYANFAWRPGKLFDSVNRALTIFVASRAELKAQTFSTNYQKWNSETRGNIFPSLCYIPVGRDRTTSWVPKLGQRIELSILNKILASKTTFADFLGKSNHTIYYRTTGGLYWKVFTDFAPNFVCNGKAGHSSRETVLTMAKASYVKAAIALLSSDLFWWWYTITSNLRDLNPSDIHLFPVPDTVLNDQTMSLLGEKYLKDLRLNSRMLVRQQKQTGTTETQSFKIQKSKPIIEEIDKVLGKHFGLSIEEIDFLINYDIKYRVGVTDDDDDDES
jgi:hypothetical protein